MGPKILIFSHRSEGAVTSLKVKPRIPGKISPALKFEKSTFRSRYCILNLYKNTLFDVSSMRIILTNPSTFDFIISFLFFPHCFIFHFTNSQILFLKFTFLLNVSTFYLVISTFHPFNLSSLDIYIPYRYFHRFNSKRARRFPNLFSQNNDSAFYWQRKKKESRGGGTARIKPLRYSR